MAYEGFTGRLSKEKQDLHDIKNSAAEFFRVNRIPQEIERALNELYFHKPEDVHGYLANHFINLSAPPKISRLKGKEVYDARGQLSTEAEVFCIICNKEKSMSSAVVSSHFGPKETSLDWNTQVRADHVMTAVQWINEPLNNLLKGLNPCDQSEVDHILSNFFMARHLEEKDIRNKEKQESHFSSEAEVALPSPPPDQTKDKKSVDRGKKSNTAEKPFPSTEPPEPVLPGSLAIGSVSLAVAKTGAQIYSIPLYKYIAALNRKAPTQFHIPVPLVTLLSCGKNSPGKLNLLEEVILIPKVGQRVRQIITMTLELQKEIMRIMNTSTKAGATQAILCDSGAPAVSYERPEQPLDLITEACTNFGLTVGTEIYLAVNCAAPELMDFSKGKYEVATGVLKSPDELVDMYQALISKYPAVVALIDPFRREDIDQWEKLSNVLGDSCSLLSDTTYKSKTPPLLGARGHILKHIHETTVSDLIRITSEHQGSVFVGTTCSEPCSDASLSDIAVALGLDYVKLGGLNGAERMTKYNRLISIEEELAQQGILVFKEKHPPPLFTEKPLEESTERTV
ncbi:enolase 4-like isoform X1 [Micropterus salmoides]|uniref:enolase 4-like isoform X1 n=1 Tax=Micropterus salmoides TaxID=27706 RepID=UPI0018EB8B39|nr:enolase 4-like isoform X1 [Micropterus salmoides]